MQASLRAFQNTSLLTCVGLSSVALAICVLGVRIGGSAALGITAVLILPLLGMAFLQSRAARRIAVAFESDRDAAMRAHSNLQAALDSMSQGLVLCSASADVVAVNRRFLTMFDMPGDQVSPGMPVADLIRLQGKAANMPKVQVDAIVHERLNRPPGASGQLVVQFAQKDYQIAYQPRPEGGWACTFDDVTDKLEAQRRLAFLAHHDALTGLPNRVQLRENIDRTIAAGSPFAVMLIDLDRFKQANDTFGHAVGDGLLVAVAGRLRALLRDGDSLARLGGDEFAVVMATPGGRDDAERQARLVVETLATPFEVDGHRICIGGSVGVTHHPSGAGSGVRLDVDTLLKEADVALYDGKRTGGNVHRFVQPRLEHRSAA